MVNNRLCLLTLLAHGTLFSLVYGELEERPHKTTPHIAWPPPKQPMEEAAYVERDDDNDDNDNDESGHKKKFKTYSPSPTTHRNGNELGDSITVVVITPNTSAANNRPMATSSQTLQSTTKTTTKTTALNSSAAQSSEETTLVTEINEDQNTLNRLRQVIVIAVVVGCLGLIAIVVTCLLFTRRRIRKKGPRRTLSARTATTPALAPAMSTAPSPDVTENPFRDPDENRRSVEHVPPVNATDDYHDVDAVYNDARWRQSQPDMDDDPFNPPEPSAPSAKEIHGHDAVYSEHPCSRHASPSEHTLPPLTFLDEPPPSYTPSAPPHYLLPSDAPGHSTPS